MSTAPEPAIKSYFFGKGYADLRATITESWQRNLASASDHFGKAGRLFPGEMGDKAQAILYGAAAVSVVVFGTAFFLLASVLHIAVLFTFFLLIYIGFTLVYLTERGYLAWRQFFTVCPDCHQKSRLPEYYCRRCGEVHRRLIPSSYGILHHTCTCGEKLPATFFLKRGELKSRCPECQNLLEAGHTESRKAFVPVFGGPSVGKSAFLFSAVHQLVDQSASLGFQPSFLESRTESEYQRVCEQLAQGRTPDKTLAALPRAFNVQLQRSGQSPRVLYLYDPAGEAFNETEGMVLHRYQEYLSGLVFLIDPFTLPAVQEQYEDLLPGVRDALKPSSLPVEDALSRILISMEEHFGMEPTARIKQPVAVVINKTDAFDLEQVIGEPVVQARIKASPEPVTAETAQGQIIREQLLRWDQAHLVQQLEARCTRVRYFTCSSLGRMPDGTTRPFEARGVLEPLLWILGLADSAFAAQARKAA
ncbi:MAG TPA: hypothetical protein VFC23_15380 [Thermoanaerobaculia bacterium]|nr:hypothetical protein [Thermoanaerobaculia bacterium]